MANCKFCGAEIIFIETPNGHKMPCDTKIIPVWQLAKGKKRAVIGSGEVIACEYEPVPFIGEQLAYMPHWANCPGAGKARLRK